MSDHKGYIKGFRFRLNIPGFQSHEFSSFCPGQGRALIERGVKIERDSDMYDWQVSGDERIIWVDTFDRDGGPAHTWVLEGAKPADNSYAVEGFEKSDNRVLMESLAITYTSLRMGTEEDRKLTCKLERAIGNDRVSSQEAHRF